PVLTFCELWPYCEKRCSYCNFNKYIPRNLDEQKMRNCLVQEAQTLIQLSQVKRITSVFFGGGTPSLANPLTIAAVLDTVSQCAHLAEGTEVTLEANPTSADASCLAEFQKAGINRLSIGVQSLNNTELKLLGRNHTSCDALRTLEEAKKLFAGRTSIDLIFGLPGQTNASWIQGLEELLTVCDDHISLYQLTLERGTSLFKQVHQGTLPMPDPDVVSEMYECSRHVLQNSGFHQYEVSNFARNGALSTHNLSYWQGSQYIGIGPGAHGRFVPWGDGKVHREARIQTLEPDVWMKEVLAVGHGTRKRTELKGGGEDFQLKGLIPSSQSLGWQWWVGPEARNGWSHSDSYLDMVATFQLWRIQRLLCYSSLHPSAGPGFPKLGAPAAFGLQFTSSPATGPGSWDYENCSPTTAGDLSFGKLI
uniref:Radical S-adenosyl methionine domain-containing protein n=1 Tax=Podarcis muralis TaxID=64176 RepID=A0A670JDB1_PODMU